MSCSADIAIAALNSIPDHLAIVDHGGSIVFVNPAWIEYGRTRGYERSDDWRGINYLEACEAAAATGHNDSQVVVAGLHDCFASKIVEFSHTYACHGPDEQAWFSVSIRAILVGSSRYFMISHQDITAPVIAHKKLQSLSLTDSLTGVSNRRGFDLALSREWRRDKRNGNPLSLILLDIDRFKQFNDNYGHLAGDQCLKDIGKTVQSFARRPGDLAARYGGEEFALIMGATGETKAQDIAEQLLMSIRNLHITHDYAEDHSLLTASIGVATVEPDKTTSEKQVIELADQALYDAKRIGRNCVCNRSTALAKK